MQRSSARLENKAKRRKFEETDDTNSIISSKINCNTTRKVATIRSVLNPTMLCLSNIIQKIVIWLKPFEIVRLTRACKEFNVLLSHQKIWKPLCPPEIILHNPDTRNYRKVYQEYLNYTKQTMMPLLSFRTGGQALEIADCNQFTKFEFEVQFKNIAENYISLIKMMRKIVCPDEYSGLSFEWKLCLTQITKSGNRDFSCTLSTFKTKEDQFYYQTLPFDPLTSLRFLGPGEVSTLQFELPLQWLLNEAKETESQNPLYYYFRRRKKHKFRIFIIYSCVNRTTLNITEGSFQTTSSYLSLTRNDTI